MDGIPARVARARWRRVVDQISTLALSLLLGLIVWLIAINQENPLVQDTFSESIPVTVRGLSESLQPVQDLSRETVRVVVRAPRSSWENLDVNDFSAYIDLTGLGGGTHEVPIVVDVVRDPRVQIMEVQRSAMRVQLDRVAEKSVPVRVDVLDSTAFGYDWQTPIVDPITVTVRGPETQIEQVTSAKAEVFLRNAKNQVERTQTVTPQNAQGQAVTRVAVEPTVVHIIVPVEPWPGRKEVAVRVSLEGQPAAGYRLSNVRVNPSTVVLLGATEALAQVPGFVETEPLSIAGATSEIQRRLQLIVPESVTVLEGTAVDVTASIAAIEGGTTVRQRPVVQGLGPGLDAVVPIDTLDVILSGPLPLLESLGPDDIFVIVDLTGLLPGNHVVTPRVVVPNGIRAEGVLPESVEVSIVAQPIATPAVTSTVTSTVTGTATIPVTPGITETPTTTPTPAAASPLTRTATPVAPSATTPSAATPTATATGTAAPNLRGTVTPRVTPRVTPEATRQN